MKLLPEMGGALFVLLVSTGFGLWFSNSAQIGPGLPPPAVTKEAPQATQVLSLILARNLGVYAVLLLGLVSWGLFTVGALLATGLQLGGLLGLASSAGMSTSQMFWLLAPHGTLEVPALVFGGSVGLHGSRLAFRALQRPGGSMDASTRRQLFIFAGVGLTLLVIGAFVEAFVTVGQMLPRV